MTDTATTPTPKRGRGRPRKLPAEQSPAAATASASPAERLRLDLRPSADTSGPRRAALTLTAARSALAFRSELAATAEELEQLGDPAPLVRSEAFHARAASLSLLEQVRTMLPALPAEQAATLEQSRAELLGSALAGDL